MQNMEDGQDIKKLMNDTMESVKDMLSSTTILGESINLGNDCVVYPILKITVGLLTGGGEHSAKKILKHKNYPFAGASGSGFVAQPIGFLINNKGDVKLTTLKSNDVYAQVFKSISSAFADFVKNATK